MYADFAYYSENYFGKLIPQAEFNRSALLASAYLDQLTLGRITEVTDTVKNACCACAEIFYSDYSASETSGNIESEKIGDYSITYKSSESSDVRSAKLISTAKMFLSGTGLLYRGI